MIASGLLVLFLGCMLIQLGYYIYFFSRLAFIKSKESALQNASGVSIVVCAHNEIENLKVLLPVLYAQDFPEYEIIVVDEKSTDDTFPFLWKEKETNERLKIVTITHTPPHVNSKKYGLTMGIKSAQHDIILLTDADCMPGSDQWLKTMSTPLNNDQVKIVLGYSQYRAKKGLLNLFIRFETLYTAIQYLSFALAGKPYMGVGRNLLYRKSFFLGRKGFSGYQKVIGGDDDLFVNKNGTKENTQVIVGKNSLVYSVPKDTWKAYFRQKKRHLSAGKLYGFMDKVRLGLLFFSHFLFWVTFVALLSIWYEPYLALGGFVLRMGVQYVVFYKAAQKLGDETKLWLLPFLDVLYVIYYIGTGISAVASRNIKWN